MYLIFNLFICLKRPTGDQLGRQPSRQLSNQTDLITAQRCVQHEISTTSQLTDDQVDRLWVA